MIIGVQSNTGIIPPMSKLMGFLIQEIVRCNMEKLLGVIIGVLIGLGIMCEIKYLFRK